MKERSEYEDPFELLRIARDLLSGESSDDDIRDWISRYQNLPGAQLTDNQVQLLRESSRRCLHNAKDFELLKKTDFLKSNKAMGGWNPSTKRRKIVERWMRSALGREALRLRSDVPEPGEGECC